MHKVTSSNIAAIGLTGSTLAIEFTNGHVYPSQDMPAAAFQQILQRKAGQASTSAVSSRQGKLS